MFSRLVILVTAIALAVGAYARPSGSAGKPQSYVVKPTDTLWSIASAHYSGDPRDAAGLAAHSMGQAGRCFGTPAVRARTRTPF